MERLLTRDNSQMNHDDNDKSNNDERDTQRAMGISQAASGDHVGMMALAAIDYALHRMRLFATEGAFIGKGPQSMLPRDEIWVVPGAKFPFILRAAGDGDNGTHRYIGHGYIHGIMEGEVSGLCQGAQPAQIVLV
ncbi:hypothetical protein QBC46DRAFT_50611 [Diplogelasinospora grovesii]|uniref:Uncharacterized protein n=1 Tax=Diplogelasinospora grovesii TaxID=303347 RepID=A0AAN6MZC5_9PEZI|nr:hypothetical protein QBC46DRAFT_50611 [Diplogelasinospora grovesii]